MNKIHLKLNRFFVYSFILFIIIFLGLIINFYNEEKNNERRENREYIQTLAKIKSSEITRWFNERLSDAAYLYSNFYLKENLPKLAASPNIKDSIKIAKVVETMFKSHDYKNISIIGSDKKCLVCMNPDNLDNFIADSINSALKSRSIKFTNFYRDPSGSSIDLDIYIPILIPGKPSFIIILKIDPAKIIFPTVKNWLINNSSGESFLVYREKDSVVFINTLKFNKSAPLTLKIPLIHLDVPAVKVALGIRGIVEGIDYRGEKVLADLREIENTPWLLVSKIDLSEIYKPVSNRLSFILIFLFPLFAFAGLSFLYFQSRQNYKDLLKLNESTKKFEALYQTSNDSILIIENDKIINCNAKSEEIFKIDQSNIVSKSLLDFSPEFQIDGTNSKEKFSNIIHKVNEGEPQLFEWIFKNGKAQTYCEINLSQLLIDDKNYIVGIVRDITERKNAVQALNESEERYRSLFQNNHSVMLLINPESGKIVEANPAALDFYGYSREELLRLHISDINQLPENEVRKEMEKAKAEKRRQFFFRHKLADNQIKDVEVFSGPISFGGKTFLYSIVYDITERKIAEGNIRKLSAGIEQSPASIVITDMSGKIEYVNPKFTALTGYTFEEVKGKNPNILKSGKMTQEEYGVLWKTISSKKDWRGEFLNKKKNGELYWESALISPILNEHGEITNFIAIKEDITDAKKADEAFKKMTAELMQQNRNLEQFTYIMSHNLRTPVANIIGISDAMQHVKMDDNEKTLMMKGLFSSVKKLDEVILDLSNILQIKQGVNEKKEKVSFSKLVHDIRTSILTLIEAEHAEIKTDFTSIDEMMTLKSYLYSIFYNLILNSIKYKRIDSNPLIEIKSFRDDGKLTLTFKDNGIGIDLKKKGNEVFGMYKRFHTHTEGKGMGLFMTKMQTETLGGKIQIQSEVNKGTEFKIEFEL